MRQSCPVHLSARWIIIDVDYPPKGYGYPHTGPVRWRLIAAFSRWDAGQGGQTLDISGPDVWGLRSHKVDFRVSLRRRTRERDVLT